MEENKVLLLNILKKRYEIYPEKLINILNIVELYSKSDKTKAEYEKILNSLYGLMSNDLPQTILLYFLTTVPLPNESFENNSDLSLYNLMQKSRITLPESIKYSLLEYLSKITNSQATETVQHLNTNEINQKNETVKETASNNEKNKEDAFLKPRKKIKSLKRGNTFNDYKVDYCKPLLDICSQYVIANYNLLHQFYKKKNNTVWNVLHTNPSNEEAQRCFLILKDLNKKRKWLRMIDSDNILSETLKEEFRESFTLLEKSHDLRTDSKMDAFQVSEELKTAILKYIDS